MTDDDILRLASEGPVELVIVIVNFRTPLLVRQCLESLVPERTSCSFRVIVVDNDSGDGSADQIQADLGKCSWDSWVQLIRSDRNLGFSGGNNLGLQSIGDCRAVLLLNSDTIVSKGCLRRCLDVLQNDQTIGALSCCLLNSDGSIQNVARKFPRPDYVVLTVLGFPYRWPRWFSWADMQDPGWDRRVECRRVEWLGGAFLMMPIAALRCVGGLDEDFFFYGEDVEFCHRIRKAGFYCWYEASVTTIHLGAGSSDVSRMPRNERTELRWRARYLEQRKLYGRWAEYLVWAVDSIVGAKRKVQHWIKS